MRPVLAARVASVVRVVRVATTVHVATEVTVVRAVKVSMAPAVMEATVAPAAKIQSKLIKLKYEDGCFRKEAPVFSVVAYTAVIWSLSITCR